MSKADKMFEELGYIKRENQEFIRYSFKTTKGQVDISFWKPYKYINRTLCGDLVTYIDMQELKAINEKVKELRMGGINK